MLLSGISSGGAVVRSFRRIANPFYVFLEEIGHWATLSVIIRRLGKPLFASYRRCNDRRLLGEIERLISNPRLLEEENAVRYMRRAIRSYSRSALPNEVFVKAAKLYSYDEDVRKALKENLPQLSRYIEEFIEAQKRYEGGL